MMSMPAPAAVNPNGAGMRTRPPMATCPDPAATPFPTATDPDKRRVRGDGNDFNLRRWRRSRFGHDDVTARRLLDINRAVAIDYLAFDAAGEQRQAGGDEDAFY